MTGRSPGHPAIVDLVRIEPPAPRASNAGFWKVAAALALGGVAIVALVIAFRPVARTGAVAYAQRNLRLAATAAAEIARGEGSPAAATRFALARRPELDHLLFVEADISSNDPEVVSVRAAAAAWTGVARAETGGCFWMRVDASGASVGGTGTDCSALQASGAVPGPWPAP